MVDAFRGERRNHPRVADGLTRTADVQLRVQFVIEIAFALARRDRVLDLFVRVTFTLKPRPELRFRQPPLR
jgi:hypothetical protein